MSGFGFGGFSLGKKSGLKKRPSNFSDGRAPQKRRHYDSGDELEEDDAPAIPSNAPQKQEEEEEDPLDAFMAGISEQVKENKTQPKAKRDDIEELDDMESYLESAKKSKSSANGEGNKSDFDSDDNFVGDAKKKREVEVLPPVDHSTITYHSFRKDFYDEHDDVAKLGDYEAHVARKAADIRITGAGISKPVGEWKHCGFDKVLTRAIEKAEYKAPTPIQCHALPIVLSGRDVIGIAKTGSGKTAAFVLPGVVHMMDQPEIGKGEGPIGVILAPTRELAQQIYVEAKKFSKGYGIRIGAIYGGASKHEQFKILKAGVELIVATPGRLIDMLKKKGTNMRRVTYLVLDEADRMFDMGFEPQIRSIVGQIRPDRQTLLFSATFKKTVEILAREILTDPIRLSVGRTGESNEDINQQIHILGKMEKWNWLARRIEDFINAGSLLIFVSQKGNCDELCGNLEALDCDPVSIHGDKAQHERDAALKAFKKGEKKVLVATDVAARGLDIKSIKTVVNFDSARDIDSYVHRIGRTGRAGEKGVAHTLVTPDDSKFAGQLVNHCEASGKDFPPELLDIAMKNNYFRNNRQRGGIGSRSRGGGGGGRGRGRGRGGGIGFSFNPPRGGPSAGRGANAIPVQGMDHPRSTCHATAAETTTRSPNNNNAQQGLGGFVKRSDISDEAFLPGTRKPQPTQHPQPVQACPSRNVPVSSSSSLPHPWTEVKTPDGRTYYWNKSTNVTSWTKPT